MAFPGTSAAFNNVIVRMQQLALQLQNTALNAASNLNGQVDADWLLSFQRSFFGTAITLSDYAATPGLDNAARSVLSGYTGSLTEDLNPVLDAAQAIIDWIYNNVPKDADGFVKAYIINSDGTVTQAQFDVATMAPLKALCQTFAATIS